MANPLKNARRLVGLALLVGLVYMAWQLTGVERPGAVDIVDVELPKQADVDAPVMDGGPEDPDKEAAKPPAESIHTRGFKVERYRSIRGLEAAEANTMPDGSHQMSGGVALKILSSTSEEPFLIRSQTGLWPEGDETAVELEGDVVVTGPEDFELKTARLLLHRESNLMVSEVPATFRRQDISGSSGSFEYDWERKDAVLRDRPIVLLSGERSKGRTVTLRAATINFQDEKGLIALRDQGSITFDGGRITGQRVDVQLTEDGGDVSTIESSGAAETLATVGGGILQSGESAASQRRVRAGRILHRFAPGTKLRLLDAEQAVVITGGAVDASGRAAENITGARVKLAFRGNADPHLTQVNAEGTPSRLSLRESEGHLESVALQQELRISEKGQPLGLTATGDASILRKEGPEQQHLEGDEVSLGFAESGTGDLERLVFAGKPGRVHTVELGPEGPTERTIVAEAGDLAMGPDEQLEEGLLERDVELAIGGVVAKGALGELEGNALVLTGEASVVAGERSSYGDKVTYDRDGGTITVEGRQHTVLKSSESDSDMTGLATSDEDAPIFVASEVLVMHEEERLAVYSSPSGTANRPDMRRGDTVLRADFIRLDDKAGTLVAEGEAEFKLRLSTAPKEGEESAGGLFDPTALIHGHCDVLTFHRESGLIEFTGSVELSQGGVLLTAESVTLQLNDENEVQWMDAEGMAFYQGSQLEAEGEKIRYRAAEGLVVVHAGRRPARAKGEQGSLVKGGVLEMTLGEDDLRVTAPFGGRTRGVSAMQQGLAASD